MLKPERLTQPPERESCLQQDEGCPQSNIEPCANRLSKSHADSREAAERIDLIEETAVRVVHIGVAVANLGKDIAGGIEKKGAGSVAEQAYRLSRQKQIRTKRQLLWDLRKENVAPAAFDEERSGSSVLRTLHSRTFVCTRDN